MTHRLRPTDDPTTDAPATDTGLSPPMHAGGDSARETRRRWMAWSLLGLPAAIGGIGRAGAQQGSSPAGTAADTSGTGGFPTRPLRLLVGFAAGGGADAIARVLAQRLTDQLGQNVLVDNRPGASSTIAADIVAKSAPDGYTLMLADSSLLIASRAMARQAIDVGSAFAPVGGAGIAPLAITVPADSTLRSLEDLAEAARRERGGLVYATSGVGTVHHLAMEVLQSRAGITLTHVPYRGASQIVPDLVGGQVPIAVLSVGAAVGQVAAGKIRALGLTSPVRLPGADWRFIADWLPDFDASPRLFVLAPAGTPAAILDRLDREIRLSLADATVAESMQKQGAVPWPIDRRALAVALPKELDAWTEQIRRANIELK